MDLRAFRGGSDFTVSVDGELFRLHKFPLYAKCAYFKVSATIGIGIGIGDETPMLICGFAGTRAGH